MTTRLPNPFLVSAAGPAGRQTAAASVSSPGRAAAVTNPAPEVMALTAPGMARDLDEVEVSTAERAFGPGDILAKFETDLASIVADINAHERFMRGLPAFIAAPSAAYLTAIFRNP